MATGTATSSGSGRDVEREAAARDEALYRRVFLESPVAAITFDRAGCVLEANRACAELLGCEDDELVGKPLPDIFDPAQRSLESERIGRLFAGDLETKSVERTLTAADGRALWVLYSVATAGPGADRSQMGIAQLQEIGERKRIESELRRSCAQLNAAEGLASIGSWDLDLTSREVTFSVGIGRILGVAPDQLGGSLNDLLRRIYAPDRAIVRSALQRAIHERSAFDIEHRIVRADGRVRNVHTRGEVLVNATGEPSQLIGLVREITGTHLAHAGARAQRELDADAAVHATTQDLGGASDAAARSRLTRRQLEVLRLVADGLTNAAIAKRLFITEATVKWHLKQTLAKTGAANRAEAVARVFSRRSKAES